MAAASILYRTAFAVIPEEQSNMCAVNGSQVAAPFNTSVSLVQTGFGHKKTPHASAASKLSTTPTVAICCCPICHFVHVHPFSWHARRCHPGVWP